MKLDILTHDQEYMVQAEADDMREILEFAAQQRKEEIERNRYKPPAKK